MRREIRTISAGRVFMREGEKPQLMAILYSGWAFRFKQLSDGRRQIPSFLIPGDTLVLENLCFPHFPLSFSVKAMTSISTCVFAVDDVLGLVRSSDVQAQEVAVVQQRYFANLHERMIGLGRRMAQGRLAQLLLELEARLARRKLVAQDSFDFPPRQEHLADALGLTTVYVNRMLVALRRQGIIDFSRDRMTIRSRAELRRIADEG